MFSIHSAALIHLLAAVTVMPGKTLNPEITLPKHSAPVCAPRAPRGIAQQSFLLPTPGFQQHTALILSNN